MLPPQEGLVDKNRQRFCALKGAACVVAGVHSSLINQNSGEKKNLNQNNTYIHICTVSAVLPLCSYCSCVLSVGCLLEIVVPQAHHLYCFLVTLTTECSRLLDFSEMSHYTPYCLHKTKQIHSLSNKSRCLLHSFILTTFLFSIIFPLTLLFKSHRNKEDWRIMRFIQST